ncbi:pyridoxal-phosphate dependent enzyme [Paraburkholderia caribensis]|uniref:Pyridoxal-5'-phosphate-dependent protein beta subunit n=2 Tax=Paraburkholderia TaxID=1822464 RepID=B2JXT2_PARP8|nr:MULTISPECIES: pyridoxal-phosphate dependent enzyme [Paraburkholderia]ACC76440.1 Pyridoxal-5'-phosphate-dependent protein beta subunit [Paraburkholderia phymatum STM815]MCO4879397.1 pyridoxal-phosphate dependent enzyme [Paraburkholderia caribensis]
MLSKLNPNVAAMKCLQCGQLYPLNDYFEGCPLCLQSGTPASVVPHFADFPTELHHGNFGEWMSYGCPSGLGEGNTPLSSLPRLAATLGIEALYAKNEFANPTGSHKDRMSAIVAQRALDIRAKTIAVASSGNAGVSMAAYAARAGIDCVVVTTPDMSQNWRRAIEMHGARIIAMESSDDRWVLIARHARRGDWYPATNYLMPPVGSNPFGVDGYRAIALELYLQFPAVPPTDILVPTARGDLLWGIAKGYQDLRNTGLISVTPRVHAVEPFPRIGRAREGHGMVCSNFSGDTAMVSIGGNTVTFQSLLALELTDASGVAVNDQEASHDRLLLAKEGLYVELSSAAAVSGLRKLVAQGKIGARSRVVMIATSHGYKEQSEPEFSGQLISTPLMHEG